MTVPVQWIRRLGLTLLWLAVTAAVAFLVARAAGDDDATDVTAPIPPIAADERSTVTLSEQVIAPVVSGDGTVMHDTDDDRWLLVAPATAAEVAYRLLDPPVAFWQGYGPNEWSLGAWDCNLTTNHYGLHDMEPGRWNYVADGLVEGYEFCTMAQHYDPPNYPLWFGGDLSWD